MAFDVTQNTLFATKKANIEPQVVIEIDGVARIYGSSSILKLIRIGDEDLIIDGSWVIGGSKPIKNQASLVSFGSGTSTKITQQLNTDTGESSSISSMQVTLVDKDLEITKLISPGLVIDDVLGRRFRVWLGFNGTNYKEDFVTIHRGIVDDITADPGSITFNISHPDQKKRQEIFTIEKTTLASSINPTATSIPLVDASKFILPITGPDSTIDADFETLIQIEDEVIKYTGVSTNTLTGCIRGYNSTNNVSHTADKGVEQRFKLSGNVIKLAEKLMLSGWNGPCISNVKASHFVQTDALTSVANAIYIASTDLNRDYGLVVGDFISTTGAVSGSNNVTNRKILSINTNSEGSYVVVDGASLVYEVDSPALLSIRSQFDVWPIGLRMVTDEVDIKEHEKIYRTFLSSFDYRFIIKEAITGKEFIEKQLLRPAACFTVPRKAQSSIGYHIGPIPSSKIKTINTDNITNPAQLRVRRGTGKNFYNTVIYKFEKDLVDAYKSGVVETSQTSRTRIDVGTRPLVIAADGMRTDLFGFSRATTASARRLNRYKYGAEYIDGIKLMFSEGYNIDVGDIILADFSSLNVVNTSSGNRSPALKFYEVQNKSLDIKTGEISINVTDTNFSTSSRYALISPSSRIKTVISNSEFVIESSFSSVYGDNEGLKWKRYEGENIKIRKSDYSVMQSGKIKSVSGNTVTLSSPMATAFSVGDYLEFDYYNFESININILYGFMTNNPTFADGKPQYKMI